MKKGMKTWMVLAAIGMAGMASWGEGWADEPLKWEMKGQPEAAVNGTRGTVPGGEKRWMICPHPGKEGVEKGAEEQVPPDAAEPKAPAKKTPGKGGGEEALRIVAGTLKVIDNFAWLVRLLVH